MRQILLALGIFAQICILADQTFGGSETPSARGVPTFTLDQAILTALQRNPDILRAEQEIKRTKGVIIEIRAQALPHITPAGTFEWTDPNLIGARILGTTSTTSGSVGTSASASTGTGTGPALFASPGSAGMSTGAGSALFASPQSQVSDPPAVAAPTATPGVTNTELSDISYTISVLGTQLVFNGTTWPSIRGSV